MYGFASPLHENPVMGQARVTQDRVPAPQASVSRQVRGQCHISCHISKGIESGNSYMGPDPKIVCLDFVWFVLVLSSSYLLVSKVRVVKSFRLRPYDAEYTTSHPNREVKLRTASIVLRWGTTREVLVL